MPFKINCRQDSDHKIPIHPMATTYRNFYQFDIIKTTKKITKK
ncbi:hypothetical protein AO369_0603 [Moraxella catarrhalis]|nr:hypothetical protein AO369_0603 [Moraxella catarrhalis]